MIGRRLSPEVRMIKERRLADLEEQAAIYGIDAPPHIRNEIEDLQIELEVVHLVGKPPVDPKITNGSNYADLVMKFLGDHARRLTSMEAWQQRREVEIVEDRKVGERNNRIGSFIMGAIIIATAVNAGLTMIILVILLNR